MLTLVVLRPSNLMLPVTMHVLKIIFWAPGIQLSQVVVKKLISLQISQVLEQVEKN